MDGLVSVVTALKNQSGLAQKALAAELLLLSPPWSAFVYLNGLPIPDPSPSDPASLLRFDVVPLNL